MRGGENSVRNNFYVTCRQIAVGFRNSLSESVSRFFFAERIGNHPHAKFVILQPCLEVWNQYIKQVSFGLVEVAEVRAPGHFTDNADPGFPEFWPHGVDLPWSARPVRAVRFAESFQPRLREVG